MALVLWLVSAWSQGGCSSCKGHRTSAVLKKECPVFLSFLFLKTILFIYSFLAVLGLRCCMGFPLVVVSGLLIAVASLVVEDAWASEVASYGLNSCGSQALEQRLSSCGAWTCCSVAYGIFPDQGSNPCLLHWQADSLPLSHQGSPVHF